MNFLFQSTIFEEGQKLDYRVYQFKLTPGKYKAELLTSSASTPVKDVVFWKEKDGWKTNSKLKAAQHLVEILGSDIDHHKN